MGPIQDHLWYPSWVHMGDCAVCGHVRESAIHLFEAPDAKEHGRDGGHGECQTPPLFKNL